MNNNNNMNENKFVLMPTRHQHEEIDGLPSVFKETLDIKTVEFTSEFKEFISENEGQSVFLYNNNKIM
jgi:gentisate 1,2-dioxygenase